MAKNNNTVHKAMYSSKYPTKSYVCADLSVCALLIYCQSNHPEHPALQGIYRVLTVLRVDLTKPVPKWKYPKVQDKSVSIQKESRD